MIRIGKTFSLLFAVSLAAVMAGGCGGGAAGKPELPASVTPGWKLGSYEATAKPAEVPESPECWKAAYAAEQAKAEVVICGYKVEGSAFDAAQRARAEAETVKFQAGRYLVQVKWSNTTKTNITALVRAVQKVLPAK